MTTVTPRGRIKKPAGWGAGGQTYCSMVEVARVELASKYVNYSVPTGLVDWRV